MPDRVAKSLYVGGYPRKRLVDAVKPKNAGSHFYIISCLEVLEIVVGELGWSSRGGRLGNLHSGGLDRSEREA